MDDDQIRRTLRPLRLIRSARIYATLAAALAVAMACSAAPAERSASDEREEVCWPSVESKLNTIAQRYELPGIVFLAGNQTGKIFGISAGKLDPNTPVAVASGSKLLVSMIAMRVLNRLDIPLDTEIGQFFDLEEPVKSAITIRQLLSHTSGIPPQAVFADLGTESSLVPTAMRLLERPLDYPPGSQFSYGGSSYQVLGALLEIASGTSWPELVEQELVTPLGLTDLSFGHPLKPDSDGTPHIGGGATISASDYAIILTSLTSILVTGPGSSSIYGEIFEDQINSIEQRDYPGMVNTPFEYGLGVWKDCGPSSEHCGLWQSAGAFGTIPAVDPRSRQWFLIVTFGRIAEMYDDELELLALSSTCASKAQTRR